ncbi:MAG: S-methyl-5'-thioinosine phosphorylase [Pseudomonadota bacterium]
MTTRAVIGGTGTERWHGAEMIETRQLANQFGRCSAPAECIEVAGQRCWFLSRHGPGHDVAPHRINYRANLRGLADLGVRQIVALNAVGIIGDSRVCGQLAMPSQLIDYTWGRDNTFFDGVTAPLQHVSFDTPYSLSLCNSLRRAARQAQVTLHDGGVMAVTQGPRLESAAEVDRLERDGARLIGMTGMPEAVLARELDIDYASIGLVVNVAAGRGDGEDIHAQLELHVASARAQAQTLLQAWLMAE